MSKILHLKIINGEIFFNNFFSSFESRLIENGFNTEIISRHVVVNALLNMIGEIPVATLRETFIGNLIDNKIDGCPVDNSIYHEVEKCVLRSFYKLDDWGMFRLSKNNDKIYNTQTRMGLKPNDRSQQKASDKVCGYKYQGVFDWQRFRSEVNDDELFSEICFLFSSILGENPLDLSFKEVISRSSKIDTKEIIDKFFDERGFINKNNGGVCAGKTYIYRILNNIKNKKFLTHDYDTETSNGTPRGDGDIRLIGGNRPLLQRVAIKNSIMVNGELMVLISNRIFEQFKKQYTPTSIFDGGILKVIDIIDSETISKDYIENLGFTPMINLKK